MKPKKNISEDQTLALISQCIDLEEDDPRRQSLLNRLDTEPDLRTEWNAYLKLDQIVCASAGPAPQCDWDRLTNQINRRCAAPLARRKRTLWMTLARPMAAAATVAFLMTVGYLAWRPASEPKTPAIARLMTPIAESAQSQQTIRVKVSRDLPEDEIATVGPGPVARVLVVTVPESSQSPAPNTDEELASLF